MNRIVQSHKIFYLHSFHESSYLYLLEWVLWERVEGIRSDKDWTNAMTQLCSFSTVHDFWRYFNNIPRPSQVFFDGETKKRVGSEEKTIVEYCLFKKGIEPEWGDPQNSTGGSFFIRQSLDVNVLDMFWNNLVLGVVGETIEEAVSGDTEDCINGVRVVDKGKGNITMFRLELWIKTRDAEKKEKVRQHLTECIMNGLNERSLKKGAPRFEFKDHS